MDNQTEHETDGGALAPASLDGRQMAIVTRLARSWARAEDELDLFNEGLSPAAPEEAREIAQSYLEDAQDLLDGAHLTPLLAFADILSRPVRQRLTGGEDVEIVRNHIGDLMADVALIQEQIAAFEQGTGPRREQAWEKAARRAIRGKLTEAGQAWRVLVRICPSVMDGAKKAASDDSTMLLEQIEDARRLHAASCKEIENLKAKAARKTAAYHHNLEREVLKSRAILGVIREKAPGLLDEIYAAVDTAQGKVPAGTCSQDREPVAA